jgi:transcriptional regulator with XRE-family HTH domain
MPFDFSKLRGKIREIYKTQADFAKAIGISTVSLSAKLNNQVQFTSGEIEKSTEALNIPKKEIPIYFFTKKVLE